MTDCPFAGPSGIPVRTLAQVLWDAATGRDFLGSTHADPHWADELEAEWAREEENHA